jgi:hypothetical protein
MKIFCTLFGLHLSLIVAGLSYAVGAAPFVPPSDLTPLKDGDNCCPTCVKKP